MSNPPSTTLMLSLPPLLPKDLLLPSPSSGLVLRWHAAGEEGYLLYHPHGRPRMRVLRHGAPGLLWQGMHASWAHLLCRLSLPHLPQGPPLLWINPTVWLNQKGPCSSPPSASSPLPKQECSPCLFCSPHLNWCTPIPPVPLGACIHTIPSAVLPPSHPQWFSGEKGFAGDSLLALLSGHVTLRQVPQNR